MPANRRGLSAIRRRDAQHAVQPRARRGVFERAEGIGLAPRGDRECGQRRLVKAAQDQLALAGIADEVADREHAGHAGLETRRIDADGCFPAEC